MNKILHILHYLDSSWKSGQFYDDGLFGHINLTPQMENKIYADTPVFEEFMKSAKTRTFPKKII